MTSLLMGDTKDDQIVTHTNTSVEEKHSISLGAWTGRPLPSSLCPPSNEPTRISKVTAIDLIQSPQRDEHQILWTKGKWAENIIRAVEDPVAKLSERIQQFDKEASATQKTQLQTPEADFQTILEQAEGKQDAKLAKDANASKWRSKLQSGLATFCKTAQHYQKMLDFMMEQAPEYTSAIWGAMKILLIPSVNHEKLKQGVISALETVGDQFALMKVIVDLQPSDLMVQTVTAAYVDFIKFLNKAVKYYTQCRGWRIVNTVARPWETRFEPIVSSIKEHVEKIRWLADVGHVVISAKIQQMTTELGYGQADIYQAQLLLAESQWKMHVEQKKHTGQMQALSDHFEKFLEINGRSKSLLNDGEDTSIGEVHEAAIEYMESIEAPTRVKEIEERPEDFLAHFTRPENKVLAFRDQVFPSTYQLGHGLEAIMHRYPTLGTIDPVGAINLRQRSEVMTWVETNQSELLWIEGFMDTEKSDWTTNFSLEVEGAAKAYSNITVLTFFCSEETGSTSFSGPEVVLQSLLFQLIDRHYSKFSWLLCRRHGLTRYRFQEAQNELDMLMTLFEDCLDVAQALCLYIVLDNIDALWSKVCIGSEGIEKFNWLFDGLRKLSVGDKILCKVLITSRLPNALNHVSKSGDGSANSTGHTYWSQIKHTIIRLPRGERQGFQVFGRPKDIHRIPIRRRTAPRDGPGADVLLEMADKDEEELDYPDDDEDDVLIESNDWRDSDDDEYGNDLLQHSKDYAKYLDSSSDSSSEIEGDIIRKDPLKQETSSADEDSDLGANLGEPLPGRDDELRHMIDSDEGRSAVREGMTQSSEQRKGEVEEEEEDGDSDECDLSLDI